MPIGNNAPNGATPEALESVLEEGNRVGLNIINAGRPTNPHTPAANVGTDGLSKP